ASIRPRLTAVGKEPGDMVDQVLDRQLQFGHGSPPWGSWGRTPPLPSHPTLQFGHGSPPWGSTGVGARRCVVVVLQFGHGSPPWGSRALPEVTASMAATLQFGHGSPPWGRAGRRPDLAAVRGASIRPRLTAVGKLATSPSSSPPTRPASIRPRLTAVG